MRTRIFLVLILFCQSPAEASHLSTAAGFSALQTEAGQDSTQISQQSFGGKLSRRAKAEQRRISTPTANVDTRDTLHSVLEAIRALPRDSSARIAQFKYERKDKPEVDIEYHKDYPLFLALPAVVKHRAVLDSSKFVYRLCETIDVYDTRISVEVPFEVYTSLRLKQAIRQNWESLVQPFGFEGEKQTTLGDLMGQITKIEIPIPKNPIFSIFGKNIIRMNINGSIDISAGFRTQKSDLYTSSPFGQSQTTPDFKQEIQVGVKGEIGDKLKIDADWNTQRTFEYENQLHVKYQGYEDEIIQSIEAGNVSLPTKSSFISGGQALFGIKAQFQLGPLNLTTVATQKKGQIKELSVSGGGKVESFEVRLTEYSDYHYFINDFYRNHYEALFRPTGRVLNDTMQWKVIQDIEVWVTAVGRYDELSDRYVVAFLDPNEVKSAQDSLSARSRYYAPVSGTRESGRFIKLEQNVDYNCDMEAGIISLRRSIPANQAIAVNYVTADGDTVGNSGRTVVDPKDTLKLVMKLIRPIQLTSGMKEAWKLMLKNRYPLKSLSISKEAFEFRIEYQIPGQNPVQEVTDKNINLIKLFGLGGDNINTNENVFNFVEGITIDEGRGEVIFPTLEPFRPSTVAQALVKYNIFPDTEQAGPTARSLSFSSIYDTTLTVAGIDTNNRYYLRGSVKGGLSDFYQLGFNIVEGSVEVISGGQRLTPGADYTVDYISGTVKIRNQLYLMQGRDLQIKFEANDLFQLASKSLLGARGEFDLGENTSLGFTIMKYSQQSLSDKVRLGEEPISNTIMGIDASTTIAAPWLTNALNFIPGIKSTAASQISLRGEAAYILPNPNTRTSPIASDGSKGVAYIDDFEGARQVIPLGSSYGMWRDASAPWFISTIDDSAAIDNIDGRSISTSESQIFSGRIQPDTTKMNYKAKACWFNVFPTDVYIPSIWGKRRSYAEGEGQISSLDFYFRPGVRGAFNYSIDLDSTIGLDNPDSTKHVKAWAGIQRILGTTVTDLVEQNIESIELWINVVTHQSGNTAKLNIDLGYISEDVIPDRALNTEDGLDLPNHNTHRGVLNPDYDWGIDTISNNREQAKYANFIDFYNAGSRPIKHPEYGADPSGDNWAQPPYGNGSPLNTDMAKDYLSVNGTEGNYGKSDQGLYPDGEDLNRNDNSDRLNAYFEYEIPLDTTDIDFKKLIIGDGGSKGREWYQIRIPLAEFKRKIGEPDLSKVEGVRLWVTDANEETLFRIVDFNLVGNQWEKRNRADSSFQISVVNVEDNPYYNSPPGVTQQKDLTRPDQNILGNEQSLNIIVKDLRRGEYKEAVKNYTFKSIDLFNYKTMKMFIHGETGDDSTTKKYHVFKYNETTGEHSAEVFVHFGDDINNYYEYRAPVRKGWVGNDVVIKFSELTAIKGANRDSLNMTEPVPVSGGPPSATYRVRGNPRLDRIKFISIGIENPAVTGYDPLISGELWANELRLTDVDDTPGWAYKFDASINFADYGSVGFSLTERDPFFHGLEDHFGSRTNSKSWNLSTSLNLSKLLPDSWNGTVLSVNYSHSESMNKPRYLPGQDILVEEEAKLVAAGRVSDTVYSSPDDVRIKSEDLSISNSYSVPTLKLNVPLKTWLVTETINKMTFGYNYTETKLRSPVTEYSKSWSWNTNFRYATDFSQKNYLSLGKSKIFFTPKQLSFGAALNRNQTQSKARTRTAQAYISHNLTAQRSMDFNWQFYEGKLFELGMSYNVNISSSLYHLDADSNNNLRPISSVLGDIFFSDRLINFGIDKDYTQTITFNTKIGTPSILKLDKIFVIGQPRYSVNYRWNNNIQAGPIGRGAAWTSSPGFSFDIDLKPISEAIWSPTPATAPADTGKGKSSSNPLKQLDKLTRILFKIPFFDFEKVSISFTQSNSAQHNGVRGSTGFPNLFARVPFFQSSLPENGPSLLYQLGFSSDPNGYVVLKTKGTFPFITGYTVPGIRADSAIINDLFSQSNQVSLRTSRRLWEGVSLQLDWRVGWSYNENKNGRTDSLGRVTSTGKTVTGNIERSYISLPPTFIFKFFNTSMENVNKKYEELSQQDPGNSKTSAAAKLSKAFEEGLEAFPWLTRILGSLAPRANWSIRWDGLEKLSFFESFTKSVSIDHAYSSKYNEGWKMTMQGTKEIMSQQVSYGFSPLVGLNITFKELMKGNLSANFQYRTLTNYSLSPASLNASEVTTSNISVTGAYSRKGFEIPLFGLSLMNNIDISFTYSYSHDSKVIYYFLNFQKDGVPYEGITRTTMEPGLTYSLSERVTAKLFYRYTRTAPDAGGSTISGSTTNEGGLSVRVAIQ